MSDSCLPSPDKAQQLLANLRRSRLEMREVTLQLEEIIAELDLGIRRQTRQRLQQSLLLNQSAD